MLLLIDGYNLIHAVGMGGIGKGPGHLERARNHLLRFLAESLDETERGQTTVVFDAVDAPKHLPDTYVLHGVNVRFARGYRDADELLEELIRAASSPKQLTVVSSDHRVQVAAQRRRATAVDSEPWYESILEQRKKKSAVVVERAEEAKPTASSDADVAFWTNAFSQPPRKKQRGR